MGVEISDLLIFVRPAAAFFATLCIGLLLRKLIFVRLAQWSRNTETKIDDIIVGALRRPSVIWCAMLAIYASLNASHIPQNMVDLAGKTLLVLAVFSVTLTLSHIATGLVKLYSGAASVATTSLTENVTKVIIFGAGILMILNSLGISITPILATLGVGGLAVALALQETLSNFFAGFHITLAKQIRIGDYIRLESGDEGYVTDINWRTTKIKMLPNNVILIPNLKLAQTIVTNYSLPDKEMAVLVNLGVHYNSDLKKVESVTCDVAKGVMKEVQGGVPGFEPFIRYGNFGDSSVQFTVILRAREFVDQYLIKHEFIKRLHERYRKEGITIPYPIRAVNYSQEKAGS